MNMFQFAVASIVDANTGYGLVHGSKHRDYAAVGQQAHEIRAKSLAALFSAIKSGIGSAIGNYLENARQRHDLETLMQMNDRLLDDIGITRGDLYAVKMGATSLEELDANRGFGRDHDQSVHDEPSVIDRVDHELDAVNERFYEQKKCA